MPLLNKNLATNSLSSLPQPIKFSLKPSSSSKSVLKKTHITGFTAPYYFLGIKKFLLYF